MSGVGKALTAEEVAVLEQKPVRWVRDACKQGLFPGAYKIGRRWRVPVEGVEQFRQNMAQSGAAAPMRLAGNRRRRRDRRTF